MTAKFLIAHADQFTTRAVEVALRDLRFNTRQAHDGLDAIDQALDDPPDAIILGATLPGLNGLDAARALRALTPTRGIPILFVTLNDEETATVRQIGLPLVEWIKGPLDLTLFREYIGRLMHQPPVFPVGRLADADRELTAISDPLTGLYARHYILHRLAYEAARATRYDHELACVLFGMRRFEDLMRRAGQIGTDRVLVALANVIRRNLRVVDLVGRIQTDEFLIVAPHTDTSGAEAIATRMMNSIEKQTFQVNGDQAMVNLCAGIAVASSNNLSDNLALFARAEAALDQARAADNPPIVIG